jgi:hypothetical protein
MCLAGELGQDGLDRDPGGGRGNCGENRCAFLRRQEAFSLVFVGERCWSRGAGKETFLGKTADMINQTSAENQMSNLQKVMPPEKACILLCRLYCIEFQCSTKSFGVHHYPVVDPLRGFQFMEKCDIS